MSDYSIEQLEPPIWKDAIDRIFKSAYRLEAVLLGVESFPPLERKKEDFSACGNMFFGYLRHETLCGVIEVENLVENLKGQQAIASLAVAPDCFRQGIGKTLVQFIVDNYTSHTFVTTGVKNVPATRLYSDLGFKLTERFTTPEGVDMIELSIFSDRSEIN